jgi:hypothetical protein
VIASSPDSKSTSRPNTQKNFILELCKEFEDELIIVLDGAPYFQASAVTDLAARDDLAFVTLPPVFTRVESGRSILETAAKGSYQPLL